MINYHEFIQTDPAICNGQPVVKFWQSVDGKPPLEEAWIKETANLPPEKQLEAVSRKLKERNPAFDAKITPKDLPNGQRELAFSADDIITLYRGFITMLSMAQWEPYSG